MLIKHKDFFERKKYFLIGKLLFFGTYVPAGKVDNKRKKAYYETARIGFSCNLKPVIARPGHKHVNYKDDDRHVSCVSFFWARSHAEGNSIGCCVK